MRASRREVLTDPTQLATIGADAPTRFEDPSRPRRPLCVARTDGELHAVLDICPHQGARLSDGVAVGGLIECPHHRVRFDLRSGRSTNGVAGSVAAYSIDVQAGRAKVRRRVRAFGWIAGLLTNRHSGRPKPRSDQQPPLDDGRRSTYVNNGMETT